MWRLLAGEGVHLARSGVLGVVLVAGSGLVAAAGLHLALGPTYPGPVAPAGGRLVLSMAVATGAVVLAYLLRDPGRAPRVAFHVAAVIVGAGLVALVKVGLHDATPGPVLPGFARWVAVAVILTAMTGSAARVASTRRRGLGRG